MASRYLQNRASSSVRGVAPLLVTLLLLGTACEVEPSDGPSADAPSPSRVSSGKPRESKDPSSPSPGPSDTQPSEEEPAPTTYELGETIPEAAAPLADALAKVHRDLDREVDSWLAAGGSLNDPQVGRIERAALFQQRIYRTMTRTPSLGRRTLQLLEEDVRERAASNFGAGVGLSSGLVPLEPPIKLDTVEPHSPHRLRSFYNTAEKRFGVHWTILAAVNFVETRFGRILGPSSAGALGPMQFLPSTWEQYGGGGDILDPHDAILGAARYLRASGALQDPARALFAYNRSDAYVDAVLTYAQEMRRRPQTFYQYYFWQVFVRTTKGDVQLTGPGAKKT